MKCLYLLSLNTQWYVQGSGKGRHWTKLLSCDEVGFMRILNRDEYHVIHLNIVLAKNKICLIIILFRNSLKNVLLNYIVYLTEWVNNFIAVSMTTIRWWYCQCQRNMLKCYNATSIEEFFTYTWLSTQTHYTDSQTVNSLILYGQYEGIKCYVYSL